LKWEKITDSDVLELKRMVGKESEPYDIEVTKGLIRHLAEAVGDSNPLWRDGGQGSKGEEGGAVASPALLICNLTNTIIQGKMSLPGKGRRLDGWREWKYISPIRPGDVITVKSRITDVYERHGKKLGRMVFMITETILTNQRSEKVGMIRGSAVRY